MKTKELQEHKIKNLLITRCLTMLIHMKIIELRKPLLKIIELQKH
jgi:hypothetical protein